MPPLCPSGGRFISRCMRVSRQLCKRCGGDGSGSIMLMMPAQLAILQYETEDENQDALRSNDNAFSFIHKYMILSEVKKKWRTRDQRYNYQINLQALNPLKTMLLFCSTELSGSRMIILDYQIRQQMTHRFHCHFNSCGLQILAFFAFCFRGCRQGLSL